MNYINLNGKITEAEKTIVSYDNRAFRYGYGLFETMLVKDGMIALAEYHWQRLFEGMKQLCFTPAKHFNEDVLSEEVIKTVKRNKLESLCRVRLQIFAGSGGLYDGKTQLPEFIIECFPLDISVTELNQNGLVLGLAAGLSKANDETANLKTTNALIYALAAQQAKQNKWNDALICNTDGNIIESTIANIFWIKDGGVFTPPLKDGCVAGVTRKKLKEVLKQTDFAVTEKSLDMDTLIDADEVFLTNSIRRMKWVGAFDATNFKLDLLTQIERLLLHKLNN